MTGIAQTVTNSSEIKLYGDLLCDNLCNLVFEGCRLLEFA